MGNRIDFNCDMGESFGMYKMGYDEEVIKYITSANIACGFHAGDPNWMRETVRLAEEQGVGIGAHPSFPDLAGFGRRNMVVSPEEAKNDVIYQMGALQAFTSSGKLQHVKPHGAMYNMAVDDGDLARAICEAVLEVDEGAAHTRAGRLEVDHHRRGHGSASGTRDIRGPRPEPGRHACFQIEAGLGHSRYRRGGGPQSSDGARR